MVGQLMNHLNQNSHLLRGQNPQRLYGRSHFATGSLTRPRRFAVFSNMIINRFNEWAILTHLEGNSQKKNKKKKLANNIHPKNHLRTIPQG